MTTRTIRERKADLLDQLDNPLLSEKEIEKIKQKLKVLDDQEA